jgi:hypothetical protein
MKDFLTFWALKQKEIVNGELGVASMNALVLSP